MASLGRCSPPTRGTTTSTLSRCPYLPKPKYGKFNYYVCLEPPSHIRFGKSSVGLRVFGRSRVSSQPSVWKKKSSGSTTLGTYFSRTWNVQMSQSLQKCGRIQRWVVQFIRVAPPLAKQDLHVPRSRYESFVRDIIDNNPTDYATAVVYTLQGHSAQYIGKAKLERSASLPG